MSYIKDEIEYLKRREAQCAELADASTNPAVKSIHFEMAATYASQINDLKHAAVAQRRQICSSRG